MEYCSMAKFHIKANVPIPREIRAVPLGYRNMVNILWLHFEFQFPFFSFMKQHNVMYIWWSHKKRDFSGHIPFSNWLSTKGLLFPLLRKLWWEVGNCITTYWYEKRSPLVLFCIASLFSFFISAGVIKTVKTGYLLHFKSKIRKERTQRKSNFLFCNFVERLFGKAWREEFVVLYEDSSLIWFRDRDRNEPEGGILLKDAPEMLAAGQVNRNYYSLSTTLNALAF